MSIPMLFAHRILIVRDATTIVRGNNVAQIVLIVLVVLLVVVVLVVASLAGAHLGRRTCACGSGRPLLAQLGLGQPSLAWTAQLFVVAIFFLLVLLGNLATPSPPGTHTHTHARTHPYAHSDQVQSAHVPSAQAPIPPLQRPGTARRASFWPWARRRCSRLTQCVVVPPQRRTHVHYTRSWTRAARSATWPPAARHCHLADVTAAAAAIQGPSAKSRPVHREAIVSHSQSTRAPTAVIRPYLRHAHLGRVQVTPQGRPRLTAHDAGQRRQCC
jgi:hypothetical protein